MSLMKNGTIIKGIGGLYSVYSDGDIYICKPRGIFRRNQQKPMIGDSVKLAELDFVTNTAVIEEILPRKNSLIRPAVANVDRIVFVVAAAAPAPDLMLLDKMLAAAVHKDIFTVLAINKCDQNEKAAAKLAEEYKAAVNAVIILSAAENCGIDELKGLLEYGVSVLAGQSGVGKSSIINRLLEEHTMDTGELTRKLERGKHTTRHSEMFALANGGLIIDSPGFSLFEITEILPEDLQNVYPELYNNKGVCRFPNCSHTGEPDCFVAELVSEKLFGEGRYVRYKSIYRDLKEKEKSRYK